MSPPRLSVIVLAWNQLPLTRRCAESVRSHTDVPYELVVVDNGSEPEAAEYARSRADVAVLNEENLGFAAGMNRGLAAASGHYVAFVNNDTVLPPLWASRLVEAFEQTERCGIALPAVTAAGNPYAVRSEPGERIVEVPSFRFLPSGVLYLMERETALALGGWGEEYQMASREDLDLLFKVWVNGLRVILDERVLVHHESSATVDTDLPDKQVHWDRNWEVFIAKWKDADPAAVPRLPDVDPARGGELLEQARIAATWMERWYERFEAATTERRRVEELKRAVAAEPAPASSPRQEKPSRGLRRFWLGARRLVPEPMRRAFFPRMRGLYYRAFPERRGGAHGR